MKPLVLLHNQLLKESVSGSMLRPTQGAGNCDGGAIGETWMARSELRTAVMHRRAETGGGQSANAEFCVLLPPLFRALHRLCLLVV